MVKNTFSKKIIKNIYWSWQKTPEWRNKMVYSLLTNCLNVFDHFVGLALKGLTLSRPLNAQVISKVIFIRKISSIKWWTLIDCKYIFFFFVFWLKKLFFNCDINRGCLVNMLSLRFSWSKFLINLRRQFRVVRRIFRTQVFAGFAVFSFFV